VNDDEDEEDDDYDHVLDDQIIPQRTSPRVKHAHYSTVISDSENGNDGKCNLSDHIELNDDFRNHTDTELYTVTYDFFQERNRWNWGKYVTNTDLDTNKFLMVSKNYFPIKGPVIQSFVNHRISHLRRQGVRNLVGTSVKASIAMDLKKCKATLRAWFTAFYVEFA
jgi:hypothetical protein